MHEETNGVQYHASLVGGHLIATLEDVTALVDTGSPTSFGAMRLPFILGRRFEIRHEYMGLDAARLSGFVGTRVDALVGADVLSNFAVVIDIAHEVLRLSDAGCCAEDEMLNSDFFMGIPIVTASVGNEGLRMFLDTGAQLSYVDPEVAEAYPPSGKVEDFYPGLGEFTTETYRVPVSIGTRKLELPCGVLPDLLQLTLTMANCRGILGTAVLKCGAIMIDYPRRTVRLGSYP